MAKSVEGTFQEKAFPRDTCEYKNWSSKFAINSVDYSKQFAPMYMLRLKALREPLKIASVEKWGSDVPVIELYQLQESKSRRCIIIGTLYKNQTLKPNILKEISAENTHYAKVVKTNFADDSDTLVLEDELQRINLSGNLNVHNLVTGIVVAVLGTDDHEGNFAVEDTCFAAPKERVYKPLPGPEKYVLLVSGLSFGNPLNGDGVSCAELLLEFLCGQAGSTEDQERMSHVVRVIFAGNTIQSKANEGLQSRKLRNLDAGTQDKLLSSMNRLDEYLSELLTSIDVDLMPGEFDPTNHMLPQQPFHPCLLPKSSQYNTMHLVTNPYMCEVDNRLIMGSSGQPINDIHSLCKMDDRLSLMESCVQWGHLAPTCPDTLHSFPCIVKDPFIMEDCPEILFSGNQPEYKTRLITAAGGQKIRLICLPSFAHTQTAVLVNLNSLECHPLSFSIGLPSSVAER